MCYEFALDTTLTIAFDTERFRLHIDGNLKKEMHMRQEGEVTNEKDQKDQVNRHT